ncbi:alpha/beta hydrolase [Streptomyces sp. NPDC059851]|uniref:alpha/beta hydrolase n=1 Tax=Streptomyces sp. NPDC059851 TaxID=3346971 RepID=UPI00365E19F3
MSLTGTPLFATVIALTATAVILPLAVWSKVRGPAVVRILTRALMMVFAQVTAIALVFIGVNREQNFYTTWGDLLGTSDYVQAANDLGPDGLGGKKIEAEPKVKQEFRPVEDVHGKVQATELDGKISGVKGDVLVYLPPQYDDPAYKDKKFPVVELIPGMPGSGKSWFKGLKVAEQLEPLMKSGKIQPFVLVSARTMLLGDTETGCANIPGKVNADSWLSVDVRKMVIDNFRVSDDPRSWGLAGYSAGAYCSAKLALSHPDRYGAAVSMSGYNDPGMEPSSLLRQDPQLRESHNLHTMLKALPTPPAVSLLITGGEGDGYQAGIALQQSAQAPTKIEVQKTTGGHTIDAWVRQLPQVFGWLSTQVKAP